MGQVQSHDASQGRPRTTFVAASRSDLKPGDRICCYRSHGFRRHGIFIGKEDCEVMLCHGTTSQHSNARSCTLNDFLFGGQLCIETSVAEARSNHDDSRERAGTIFHDVSKNELKPGDHIYCYRKLGLYTHHGIFLGIPGSCEVIHFHGTSKKRNEPKIRSCLLDEFLDGAQLRLVAYDVPFWEARLKRNEATHTQKSDGVSAVIERATYYLMNPDNWPSYNVLSNNCETFAVFCKTGQFISKQTMGGLVGDIASSLLDD